jgi:hypothetical protein
MELVDVGGGMLHDLKKLKLQDRRGPEVSEGRVEPHSVMGGLPLRLRAGPLLSPRRTETEDRGY